MAGTREEHLARVRARLEQITVQQDLSLALDPLASTEAAQLAELVRENPGDLEACYVLGWLYWYRHQAQPAGTQHPDLDAAIRYFLPCFVNGAGDQPGPLRAILAGHAAGPATAMLREAQRSDDLALISVCIQMWQRITDAIPGGHPGPQAVLIELALALRLRFWNAGELADLDAAIEVTAAAVQEAAGDDPDRGMYLSNLGSALQLKYQRTGLPADLDAAIDTGQAAVAAAPASDSDRPAYLNILGTALQIRFGMSRVPADLDQAVEIIRAAADASPAGHPDRPAFLANLSSALQTRFGRSGSSGDLNAAVDSAQAALAALPAGGGDVRAGYLNGLAIALQVRFGHTGSPADLDAAIDAGRVAVQAAPGDDPDRWMYLNNLGNALRDRFERTGTPADLDAAVETIEAAAQAVPAGHPDWAAVMSNRGIALEVRFGQTGVLADLDAAVELLQAAAEAIPAGHADRAGIFSNLGGALRSRFLRTGALADLEAAITAGRGAVDATPGGHPDRPEYLASLGGSLRARFERTGSLADLEAAVQVSRDAAETISPGHPDRATILAAYGTTLQVRFERSGDPADLDTAIHTIRSALDLTTSDLTSRAAFLNNLANTYAVRFRTAGTRSDLDTSVETASAAVQATPAGHPDRPSHLATLGNALRTRFAQDGIQADLDASIGATGAAIEMAPPGHPDRAVLVNNLGVTHRTQFEATGRHRDREAAISAFAQAAEDSSAQPSVRIQAAREAAALAAGDRPGQGADLLELAVRLLPEVASRQLERGDQQHMIARFAGLAGDAASLALASTHDPPGERAARALELLETGRAVSLSQALDTRDDLADLRQHHAGLAARFAELRDWLDQPPGGPGGLEGSGRQPGARPGPPDRPAQVAGDRHQMAGELATILSQIRALDGFTTFGQPPALSELLAEAAAGPIVTFNISHYRSDALLLTGDGVTSLPLPGLAQETLAAQVISFHEALRTAADQEAGTGTRAAAQGPLLEILGWLWDTAAGPVLTALGYHRPPPPGAAWPRIWWAPGGRLSPLPIHAAGHHLASPASGPGRPTVMDRVISSYTPTIRALRYARQHRVCAPAGGPALIVTMPVTPGLPDGALPHVTAEAARVRAHLPGAIELAEPPWPPGTSYAIPTRANVLANLPRCTIAHFACHGASHPADPSRSLLLLHDYDRHPLTVASLAPVNLSRAQLAYLSACRTAFTSAPGLFDEATHLTTAFQLAGFTHVIGTLWEINDQVAVNVADDFYTALRAGSGVVETSQSAAALNHTVRALRDRYLLTPSLWAAYLHAGA